jgi:hypothetical protein
MAMIRLGHRHLRPGKGFHFPVGAFVEYIGNVDNAIKDKLRDDLTITANLIIKEQSQEESVWSNQCSYEEAAKILKEGVPSYLPSGSDVRVVKLS